MTTNVIPTLQINHSLDVLQRLAQLRHWQQEWQVQDELLNHRLEQLDPARQVDIQRGEQIIRLQQRLRLSLVREPIEISPALVGEVGYEPLRQELCGQFASLSPTERRLWLNNFLFIMTPDLRRLNDKIAKVREQMKALDTFGRQLEASEDRQISLTDPDARSMATSGRGTGIVGYNVQTAVDAKHHLIVAHEVTNVGHDRDALVRMAKLARQATGQRDLIALADSGYFEGYQILECERAGIAAVVPRPLPSSSAAEGRFDRRDFVYDGKRDEYRCPAGQIAQKRFTTVEDGKTLYKYWPSACPSCPMKSRCTTGAYRRITRWEHEDVLETMQARLDGAPEAARLRRQTVEHVFGTLKGWMGSAHFLTKTLPRVRSEMSLQVLAYNLKRAMRLLGTRRLMAAMRA